MSTNASEAKEPFDPVRALDNFANKYASDKGRRLTFDQRCAAYASLYRGVPQVLVATAFGISRVSICLLAGCRNDPRPPIVMELEVTQPAYRTNPKTGFAEAYGAIDTKGNLAGGETVTKTYRETLSDPSLTKRRQPYQIPRYQEVAREFERLGETAFIQTYFTAHIEARLQEAALKRPVYGVPQPDAAQYAFERIGAFEAGDWFRIDWIEDGWRYATCKRDGSPRWDNALQYHGDDKGKPFKTSTEAFHYVRGAAR